MKKNIRIGISVAVITFAAIVSGSAQSASAPKTTQIDILALKRLVRPQGKPLLINFWATWCGPCRDEFPDLVKIDEEYKGKIDFLTISLHEPADKDSAIPEFLSEMKAQMPSYLLVTDNEEAAMHVVSKQWAGAMPYTILFSAKGGVLYSRQGRVKIDALKAALVKSTGSPAAGRQATSHTPKVASTHLPR